MQLLERRPEKCLDFNAIQTHDLCVAGAVLYKLRYEATYAGERSYAEFIEFKEN